MFAALLITSAIGLALFLSDRHMASRVGALERELASLRALLAGSAGTAPEVATLPIHDQSKAPATRDALATWFERVVAGRLLIWTGGIALAAGGVFLIRHSIELVTPAARMIAAALLGLALIGAGEGARRGRLLAGDPRIAQALVGAGIAVLYATAYGSHVLFGLNGDVAAAALIVLITAGALMLSLRHGAPTAALGLVGGFSAPLLVGEPEAGALPVLLYVALLDAAIFFIASRRRWSWLVAAAVAASFAWTGFYILRGPDDALAAGVFAALFGIVASLLKSSAKTFLFPPSIVALVELAFLVQQTNFVPIGWLLFGAVAAASLWVGRRPGRAFVSPMALLVTLALIAVQAAFPYDRLVPWAAVATTMLFAGGLAPVAANSRAAAFTACAALAGPLLILRSLSPVLIARPAYGAIALVLAGAALALFWLIRTRTEQADNPGAFAAAGVAALLAALGASDLAPSDYVSAAWLLLSIGLLLAGIRIGDKALRTAGLALLTVTVVKVFLIDAAALEGVLRILSFLGLGIALIGIGILYGRVLRPSSKPDTAISPKEHAG